MIKRLQEKIENFSADHPVLLALIVALIVLVVVVALSARFYSQGFYENVLIEAHGMLFDLAVIGFLVFCLNRLGEKKREQKANIQRYQEEIEDYLGWDEKEATYRIVGNIKRLNREGFTNLKLSGAHLVGANLERAHLGEANLM